jgi:hypothetical protein
MSNIYARLYNEIVLAVEEFEPYEDFSVEDCKSERDQWLNDFRDRIFFAKLEPDSCLIDQMLSALDEWVGGWGHEWTEHVQGWYIVKYAIDEFGVDIDIDQYNRYVAERYGVCWRYSKKFISEYTVK